MATIEERLRFYELDMCDAGFRKSIGRIVSKRIERALNRFYARVQTTPQTASLFRDKSHIAHAQNAQRMHWEKTFTDGLNSDYMARGTRIGRVHAQIGLEPSWYIGGYALIVEDMIHELVAPGLSRYLPWRRAAARRTAAFVKIALLDMDIAVSTYSEANEEKVRAIIGKLGGALAKVAQQDLSIRVDGLPSEYEPVRRDFNAAIGSLDGILASVIESISIISNGSQEIRSASTDLANRTEQQAASIEETTAAVNEINGIVQQTAEHSVSAKTAIGVTYSMASTGGEVVQRAVEAMGRIEKSSDEISQIISVIDGIAFQTNLLALNAGVEAARAGDAGRGFAVVANEVRELALRSAQAAKEIKDLITASSREVANGVALVADTGKSLSDILGQVGELRDSLDQIAESTQTQATSLAQINHAVGGMDQMTQQNAAMVEQCNAASRSLAAQAEELDHKARGFKLSGGLKSRSAPRAIAA